MLVLCMRLQVLVIVIPAFCRKISYLVLVIRIIICQRFMVSSWRSEIPIPIGSRTTSIMIVHHTTLVLIMKRSVVINAIIIFLKITTLNPLKIARLVRTIRDAASSVIFSIQTATYSSVITNQFQPPLVFLQRTGITVTAVVESHSLDANLTRNFTIRSGIRLSVVITAVIRVTIPRPWRNLRRRWWIRSDGGTALVVNERII